MIIPLTFGSDVFVPTAKPPEWLQVWAKVSPITRLSDAAWALMLGQPVGDSVFVSLLWIIAIAVVFAPLGVWAYRRR